MKGASFKERIRYKIDNLMSKGTVSLVIMLFSITAIVVVVAGVCSSLIDGQRDVSVFKSIWMSLMHAIDGGTLAGDDGNLLFILLMSIVTICGIFITSMLIGIINTGLESKMAALRKGKSRVLENGHTVILGFNDSIFTIISELAIANENKKNPKIVVLGEADKEYMEEEIRLHIPDIKNTVLICRSGNSADRSALLKCAIETCRSVIINEQDDFQVIKSILVVTGILKAVPDCKAYMTVTVQNLNNIDAARIAGEGHAEILYFKSTISRIMAQTCRQPGMSSVFTELFDFDGDEIYIESISSAVGKTMAELICLFESASVIGIRKKDVVMLNPSMDTVYEEDDKLILIASDDGVSFPLSSSPPIESGHICHDTKGPSYVQEDDLLVLGYNNLLPEMLIELDHYIKRNTSVKVALTNPENGIVLEDLKTCIRNMTLSVSVCDIFNRGVLEQLAGSGYEHILLLSDLGCNSEDADAKTLMLLLHLRDIAQKKQCKFSITSEMLNVRNQELATVANVNDFVISSNITSLIIAQISQERELSLLFQDLLDEDGSEIYMKPVNLFVKTGVPVSLFTVAHAAAQRGDVFIGYKHFTDAGDLHSFTITTNPLKSSHVIFSENDLLIVISEEA